MVCTTMGDGGAGGLLMVSDSVRVDGLDTCVMNRKRPEMDIGVFDSDTWSLLHVLVYSIES